MVGGMENRCRCTDRRRTKACTGLTRDRGLTAKNRKSIPRLTTDCRMVCVKCTHLWECLIKLIHAAEHVLANPAGRLEIGRFLPVVLWANFPRRTVKPSTTSSAFLPVPPPSHVTLSPGRVWLARADWDGADRTNDGAEPDEEQARRHAGAAHRHRHCHRQIM